MHACRPAEGLPLEGAEKYDHQQAYQTVFYVKTPENVLNGVSFNNYPVQPQIFHQKVRDLPSSPHSKWKALILSAFLFQWIGISRIFDADSTFFKLTIKKT